MIQEEHTKHRRAKGEDGASRGRLRPVLFVAGLLAGLAGCTPDEGGDDPSEERESPIETDLDSSVDLMDLSSDEAHQYCEDILRYLSEEIPTSVSCRGEGFAAAVGARAADLDVVEACQAAMTTCEAATVAAWESACDGVTDVGMCDTTVGVSLLCASDQTSEYLIALMQIPPCEDLPEYFADPWAVDLPEIPRSCAGLHSDCLVLE